ncbi:hypothetical protein BKA80DRAFT_261088 [Phyllosticta citrichinensis]
MAEGRLGGQQGQAGLWGGRNKTTYGCEPDAMTSDSSPGESARSEVGGREERQVGGGDCLWLRWPGAGQQSGSRWEGWEGWRDCPGQSQAPGRWVVEEVQAAAGGVVDGGYRGERGAAITCMERRGNGVAEAHARAQRATGTGGRTAPTGWRSEPRVETNGEVGWVGLGNSALVDGDVDVS